MTNWHKFSERKPKKEGKYLFALNNWDAESERGNPIYTGDVTIAYWKNSSFWATNGIASLIDPDEWACVPRPKKAQKP